LKFALDGFIAIKLAIDYDPGLSVFTGNRLVSGGQIDDAETRVPKTYSAILRHPMLLTIRSAMIEALSSPLQCSFGTRKATGEERDNSTHRV
jgi:hypothetical protein